MAEFTFEIEENYWSYLKMIKDGPRSLIEYLLMEHQPSMTSVPGVLTIPRWGKGSLLAMRNFKFYSMRLLINK